MAIRADFFTVLAAASCLVPVLADAQQPSATAAPPPATTTVTAPPPATAAPTATTTTPPSPRNVSGTSWSPVGVAPQAAPRRTWRPAGPTAVLPGFEELPDGSSRLFVELTKNVPVEEKKAAGTVTYVLKGAHVNVWNNYHPLVTIHFNTPVWRARLVPHGNDLHFVVELRANVVPVWKVNPGRDGEAMLEVAFPSGQFLAGEQPAPPIQLPRATPLPAQ